MSEFERIVTMSPAFDRRDPDPSKNYGIHGVELRMVLKGPKGATQFVLYTNWMLPNVERETWSKGHDTGTLRILTSPTAADFGYHWHRPHYSGHDAMTCDLLPAGKCYYDGSSLNADRIFDVLRSEGSDGVWRELESLYRSLEADDAEAALTADRRREPLSGDCGGC